MSIPYFDRSLSFSAPSFWWDYYDANPDECQYCGNVSKGNMSMCGACESDMEQYAMEDEQ